MSEKMNKIAEHLQLDTVSPATRLLEKRRVMYEVQESFDEEKKNFKKKEQAFKKREMDLRTRDFEIQEKLIKFSKHLQENDAKKKRADNRANEEAKSVKGINKDIKEKKEDLQKTKNISYKIEKEVSAMRKYEEFLEKVRNSYPDEFPELADILTRHKTLSSSNTKLKEEQSKIDKGVEDYRNKIADYEKQKINEIMSLNNEIALLQKTLEQIEEEKNELQKEVEQKNSNASSQSSQLGKVLMAIDNLYARCQTKSEHLKHKIDGDDKTNNFDDFQEKGKVAKKQLDVIAMYLEDFTTIIDKIQNKEKRGAGGGFTETMV